MIRQGVTLWNEWHNQNFLEKVDLHRAYLTEADISQANLSITDPGGGQPQPRNLSEVNLSGANLISVISLLQTFNGRT
jgi:uncharacterized protein YjbI with pentapeptide repeats